MRASPRAWPARSADSAAGQASASKRQRRIRRYRGRTPGSPPPPALVTASNLPLKLIAQEASPLNTQRDCPEIDSQHLLPQVGRQPRRPVVTGAPEGVLIFLSRIPAGQRMAKVRYRAAAGVDFLGQNRGSQSAAGPRRPRRGGREGTPARSAAWTADATSRAVSASMTMFRRSRTRRTTWPACGGASCGPMIAGEGPVASASVTPGTVLLGCR